MSYFIGSFIPPKIADLVWRQRPQLENVRWVKPERYHTTFRYFENIAQSRLVTVLTETEQFREHFPVCCQTTQFSGFPSAARARVIIVLLDLGEFSLPPAMRSSKEFTPHVTVGYARRGRIQLNEYPFDSAFELEAPKLVHSTGGVYTAIRSVDDDGGR